MFCFFEGISLYCIRTEFTSGQAIESTMELLCAQTDHLHNCENKPFEQLQEAQEKLQGCFFCDCVCVYFPRNFQIARIFFDFLANPHFGPISPRDHET